MPLLCLDVNLGHGVSPQIVIYEGDDPIEVANRFVVEYGKHFKSYIKYRAWRDEAIEINRGNKTAANEDKYII